MSNVNRIVSVAGWDGILPLLVAVAPLAVRIFPAQHNVEVIAAIFLPIAFALVRVHVGTHQLTEATGGAVGYGRQLELAGAIILLLVFEMYVMALHFAKDEPLSAWLLALPLLAGYIVAIWFALRPATDGGRIANLIQCIDTCWLGKSVAR